VCCQSNRPISHLLLLPSGPSPFPVKLLITQRVVLSVHEYTSISTDKTSLKADRQVWGGVGLTWNHFDFTPISPWPPLKPSQITVKTEAPGPTAPVDQWHQGNQRNPNILRKTKDSLSIPLRTYEGSTREAPSSRRTTFYLISRQSQAERPKGRAPEQDDY
jgi:hypothetical protein